MAESLPIISLTSTLPGPDCQMRLISTWRRPHVSCVLLSSKCPGPDGGGVVKVLTTQFVVPSARSPVRGLENSARPGILAVTRQPSTQGRKSLRLCLAGLSGRRFDAVAELSELPDHLPSAPLLRFFGDHWAAFFVTNSLMQDEPDESTLSMGNGPNGLIVSQAGD